MIREDRVKGMAVSVVKGSLLLVNLAILRGFSIHVNREVGHLAQVNP